MAHQSENAARLVVNRIEIDDLRGLPDPDSSKPEVWLFRLPDYRTSIDFERSESWHRCLRTFCERLNESSIVVFLTSPEDAAATWTALSSLMQYQLLISVKLNAAFSTMRGQLPRYHNELLVLSKYRTTLRHTKTRQAYTFCPACNKTTKDYGGKKHLYHEYGTALSDVWRDITYAPGGDIHAIEDRLADLFGLAEYGSLKSVSVSKVEQLIHNYRDLETSDDYLPIRKNNNITSELILGDVFDALATVPDESVDFCFSDPPYNLAKRYDTWDDSLKADEYLSWCDSWIDELARVLRPGGTVAIINIPVLAIRHFTHMQKSLRFQSWITWDGLSLPVRNIMPANYAVVCFSKGSPRPLPGLGSEIRSELESHSLTTQRENYCVRASCVSKRRQGSDRDIVTDLWWDTHRVKHNSRRVDHPCQLPPAFMRRLIALFSAEEEVVLDPFNGAGTTTLCAAQLNRRFIGIELSQKYHLIASERHENLNNGVDPFGKMSSIPVAKNSRVNRVSGVKYEVPKKTLQLEIKRIAEELGRLPSREEAETLAEYPIRLYDEYFASWGDACAAAKTTGMTETRDH